MPSNPPPADSGNFTGLVRECPRAPFWLNGAGERMYRQLHGEGSGSASEKPDSSFSRSPPAGHHDGRECTQENAQQQTDAPGQLGIRKRLPVGDIDRPHHRRAIRVGRAEALDEIASSSAASCGSGRSCCSAAGWRASDSARHRCLRRPCSPVGLPVDSGRGRPPRSADRPRPGRGARAPPSAALLPAAGGPYATGPPSRWPARRPAHGNRPARSSGSADRRKASAPASGSCGTAWPRTSLGA